MELLAKAETAPIEVNCQGGMASTNKDLRRLVHDGHLKQTRVVYSNRTHTAFEITPTGKIALNANRYVVPKDPQAEHDAYWMSDHFARNRLRPPLEKRSTGRGSFAKSNRLALARNSADTARLVSAALLEAEAEPFVLDTGWIDPDTLTRHPLHKVLERGYRPDDGFTLCDRLFNARTLHLRRYLKDSRALPEFDMLVVRTLGGGAVVGRFQNDDQMESYELRKPIFAEWLEKKKADPTLDEPHFPIAPKVYRLLMLASSETMATYLQIGFR